MNTGLHRVWTCARSKLHPLSTCSCSAKARQSIVPWGSECCKLPPRTTQIIDRIFSKYWLTQSQWRGYQPRKFNQTKVSLPPTNMCIYVCSCVCMCWMHSYRQNLWCKYYAHMYLQYLSPNMLTVIAIKSNSDFLSEFLAKVTNPLLFKACPGRLFHLWYM